MEPSNQRGVQLPPPIQDVVQLPAQGQKVAQLLSQGQEVIQLSSQGQEVVQLPLQGQKVAQLPSTGQEVTQCPSPGQEVTVRSVDEFNQLTDVIESMRRQYQINLLSPNVSTKRLRPASTASSVAIGNREEQPARGSSYFRVLSNSTDIQTLFVRADFPSEIRRQFYTPLWPDVVCNQSAAQNNVCVAHTDRRHLWRK